MDPFQLKPARSDAPRECMPRKTPIKVGLRIDVDTFRGMKRGAPNLLELLKRHGLLATFFFTVGPDNMGRNLWRLIRPAFFWKMLRTRAASLYGWDILLRGVLWPGPKIGEAHADLIRACRDDGHEIGFHAWDHHAWQTQIESWKPATIRAAIRQGMDCLTQILGRPPICSAVPGWRCTEEALLEKSRFPFAYNSDCRGDSMFLPVVNGNTLPQIQVPVTLPTYDEMVGRDGVTDRNFNERLLDRMNPSGLNVLTIHAEVEGLEKRELFSDFIKRARQRNASLVPLGELIPVKTKPIRSSIVRFDVPGREGWVAAQLPILPTPLMNR